MSLAPPVIGDGSRSSSFLPAIKCSNCGDEIEIAAMGEHICADHGVAPPTSFEDYPASMSNPYALHPSSPPRTQPIPMPAMPPMPNPLEVASIHQSPARSRTPTLSSVSGGGPKAFRGPPPRINPEAANKPFLAPRFDSPMSPAVSIRSVGSSGPKPAMSRSATSPMPRLYNPHPPSPELSANIDCAFPPFPAPINTASRPSTSNGRRTPADRAPSRPDHGLMPGQGSFDMEPKSPRLNAGESVLQRLNTLKSGPFNAKKPKSASGDSKPGSFWFGKRRPSESPAANPQPDSVPPPAVDRSEVEALPEKDFPFTRSARPTTEEVFSPTFLDQFSAEPSIMQPPDSPPAQAFAPSHDLQRSQTQPLPGQSPSEDLTSGSLSKVRSEPTIPTLDVQPPLPNFKNLESLESPRHRSNVTDGDVQDGERLDDRTHNNTPVPKPLLQHRQESTHAPSESGFSTVSSSNSANHSNSTNSRRPSPVTSAASSFEAFSPLSYDPIKYSEDEHMRVPGLSFKSVEKAAPVEPEAQVKTPPRNFARPVPPRSPSPTSDRPITTPLESPMDPALRNQSGISSLGQVMNASPPREHPSQTDGPPRSLRRGPMPPAPPLVMPNGSDDRQRQRPGPPTPGGWQPGRRNVSPRRAPNSAGPMPRMQSPISTPSPATPLDPQARPASRRGTSTKAICRGCGLAIEGKSVKAADGRLTGRWHKACFVCRSCREPFTTADFYVINNEPYCEQHYHEQNNSLCAGCHRGIEGQYIETSSSARPGLADMKFHPRCFTCWECRSVLSDDYFEINGKVFCERHALAAMRAQARVVGGGGGGGPSSGLAPPNSRSLAAERRTTRLMMMA